MTTDNIFCLKNRYLGSLQKILMSNNLNKIAKFSIYLVYRNQDSGLIIKSWFIDGI